MPELRSGAPRDQTAVNSPLPDSDDGGDGILNTPPRSTSRLSPSLAAPVGIGLAIFIAAVVSATVPTDPEDAAATIAIVAGATSAALRLSPDGVFAALLSAGFGWGDDTFAPDAQ